MREGGRRDDVADRVDVRFAGAHERVDLHEAALDLDLRSFQSAVLGDRAAAGRGENESRPRSSVLSLRPDDDLDAAVADFADSTFASVRTSMPFFLKMRVNSFEISSSSIGRSCGMHFDDRHLRAEAGEDRRELAADRAGADDEHRLRHFAELEDVIGVDDPLAVGLDVRQVFRAPSPSPG